MNLAQPLSLARGPSWRNRLALSPMTNQQSNPDGSLGEDEYRWLLSRAESGYGMVMTCAAHVQKTGQAFEGQLGIWSDEHIPGLRRLAEALARSGAVSSVQLQHAGRRSEKSLTGGVRQAVWADEKSGTTALTTAEVEQVVRDFIQAAVRAENAGFHGVELHGAHGYLLGQFLDARRNDRDDRYGGSFENRTRIFTEIIDGIRERTGAGFQLGVRLSAERNGIVLDEARSLAALLMRRGQIDYLDMSLWDVFKEPEEPQHKGRKLIDYFTELDRFDTKLGVAGKIMGTQDIVACLTAGVDFVLIGRAAILHRDFPMLVRAANDFASTPLPVARSHLADQGISDTFSNYIKSLWPHFTHD